MFFYFLGTQPSLRTAAGGRCPHRNALFVFGGHHCLPLRRVFTGLLDRRKIHRAREADRRCQPADLAARARHSLRLVEDGATAG